MAVKTDPLALATHGVVKTGGATDPLGLASFGQLVVDGIVALATELARRTQLMTLMSRYRR